MDSQFIKTKNISEGTISEAKVANHLHTFEVRSSIAEVLMKKSDIIKNPHSAGKDLRHKKSKSQVNSPSRGLRLTVSEQFHTPCSIPVSLATL